MPGRNPRENPRRRTSINPTCGNGTRDRIRGAASVSIQHAGPESKPQYETAQRPFSREKKRSSVHPPDPEDKACAEWDDTALSAGNRRLFRKTKVRRAHKGNQATPRLRCHTTRDDEPSRAVPIEPQTRSSLVTVSASQSPQRPGCAQGPPPAIDEPAGPSHGFPFWGFCRPYRRRRKIAAR